jgi:hypothetical protein
MTGHRHRLGGRMNTTVEQRLAAIAAALTPTGCAHCRNQPRVIMLIGEDAEPPTHCPACGRALPIEKVIRLVMTERPDGPQ